MDKFCEDCIHNEVCRYEAYCPSGHCNDKETIDDLRPHAVEGDNGDLISRAEMIRAVSAWHDMNRYYHPHANRKTIPTDEVIDMIENAPTVAFSSMVKVQPIVTIPHDLIDQMARTIADVINQIDWKAFFDKYLELMKEWKNEEQNRQGN